MKPLIRSHLACTVALALAGCLQVENLVSVKPDGSGTVTATVVMPKAMIEQMKQMMDGFAKGFGEATPDAKPAEKKPFELMDEAKLKENAAKMGEGVTFVSAKKISTATGEGYVATYAFTDINKLKLDQSPGSAMPEQKGGGLTASKKSEAEPVTFEFTKGKVAKLVVKNPPPKPDAEKKEKASQPETPAGDEEMAKMMMQQMFKDMRIVVAVEVAGKIVKTDAEHMTGNRATLMEMDFNKLMANPEKFAALSKAQPKTIEETKALVKGVDGIRVESKPKVTIEFQ